MKRESALEDELAHLVRERGLPEPVFQFEVETPMGSVRLDAAYPDVMVGIEADGYAWHSTPDQLRRDRHRQNHLQLMGWLLLRYTHDDITHRADEVAAEIEDLCRRRRRRRGSIQGQSYET